MARSKAGGGGDNNNAGDGDTTPPDATATAAVASYGGETARSGAERSENHVQDLKAKSEHSAMYKHKLLAHPEEEVTFTMRIQRRHQGPLSRQVHENVIIGMLEAAGTSLNSKVGGYNRSSMPRLSVVVNNKLHEAQEAAVEDPELDVEGIFKHNNRRKKKSRCKSDHDSEPAPTSLHLPPPKRRKIFRSKQDCTTEDIPEVKPRLEFNGDDRKDPVQSEIQQKQASSSVPFFPIFKPNFNSDIRQEQGGKEKKTRAKAENNVKIQQNTIKNHFISKARDSRPDDPGEAAASS